MQKWEYLSVEFTREGKDPKFYWKNKSNLDIHELGRNGWELVSIVPVSNYQGFTHELTYMFKRPLESK